MSIWAIADLHLSWARPDRRERFAERWRDHASKIETAWRAAVRPEDLVLLPGDLSLARNHRDLQPDLAWLDRLPGTKVLSAGKHHARGNGPPTAPGGTASPRSGLCSASRCSPSAATRSRPTAWSSAAPWPPRCPPTTP